MDIALEIAIEKLSALVKTSTLPTTFIVGAGISISSGLPRWNLFAKDIAEMLSQGHSRAVELIQASTGIRPEVMFQAFYRVLGNKAVDVIRAIDPHNIRQRGARCEPNVLHVFLAKLIKMGHIVVTTNFDDLIEEAAKRSCPVISSQSEIEDAIPAIRDKRFSGLVKLHGTFRKPDSSQSTDSIGAMLQEVQRAIPKQTKEVLNLMLDERPVVVFGHSGQDDFDLYQRLLAAGTVASAVTLWIMHAEQDASNWRVYQGSDITQEIESLKDLPKDSDYYEKFNPLSIVQARGGMLVKAHTRDFLKRVFPDIIDWPISESVDEVKSVVRELVKDWVASLSIKEKQAAITSLFESSGAQFLGLAREQVELLYSASTENDKAIRDLSVGRIIYKIGDSKCFDEAQSLLRSSAEFFAQNGLASKAAEAHLQLALLLNRRAITDEATREMMTNAGKAVELFVGLSQTNYGYLFDLGTAFRAYALSIHRSLPDLDTVNGQEEKKKCEALLQLARKYADASFLAVDLVGNYLGERGQAQCLNVIGLIDLKLGSRDNLAAAKKEFEGVIDLSRRSGKGFAREEFQGHRNLGLTFRGLARTGPPDERDELLEKAIGQFRQSEKQAGASDMFNVKFNIILLEVEAEFRGTNWGSILNRLVELEAMVPKDRQGMPNWHWSAWVNATAAKVAMLAQKPSEAERRAVRVIETYEQVSSNQIQNQTYGVQNGRTNLSTCMDVVNSVSHDSLLKERVQQMARRLSSLEQRIPNIQIDNRYSDPKALVKSLYQA